jgi:hypothetical protein
VSALDAELLEQRRHVEVVADHPRLAVGHDEDLAGTDVDGSVGGGDRAGRQLEWSGVIAARR